MTTPEQKHIVASVADLIRSILLGLVILAAGVAIGASLMFLHQSKPPERYGREPEILAEQMLRQLGRELNLTPQQRRRLDPVLRQHYKKLNDIRAEVRPQIVTQLEQINADIAAVLTPEQMQLWQQKIRRLEDHFPTFRGRGRGGGFGPEAGQEFGPRGPQGPRQPLGPGNHRQERFERPLPSEPNQPQPYSPPPAKDL